MNLVLTVSLLALCGVGFLIVRPWRSPGWRWLPDRMQCLFLLAAFLCAATAALGADDLVELVAPEARLTTRIVLLVDVSGSMKNDARLPRAISAALEIARKGGDQLQIACYAFGSSAARWPAPRREDSQAPEGWIELPDEEALSALHGWLSGGPVGDLTTELADPLRLALAEPRNRLSIVVISDGHVTDQVDLREVLRHGQERRRKGDLGDAVVACWRIGDAPATALRELGRQGLGGCWSDPPAPASPVPAPVQGSIR